MGGEASANHMPQAFLQEVLDAFASILLLANHLAEQLWTDTKKAAPVALQKEEQAHTGPDLDPLPTVNF